MANKVTISNTDNKVTITPQSNTNIDTSVTNTPVTVTQGTTKVVTVNALGPQGQIGPAGPVGAFNAGDDVIARNITASFNISASGQIIANSFSDINTSGFVSASSIHISAIAPSPLTINSGIYDNALKIFSTDERVNLSFSDVNTTDGQIVGIGAEEDNLILRSDQGIIEFQVGGEDRISVFQVDKSGSITTTNITASGDISASGDIIAKKWVSPSNDNTFIQFLGGNLVFHADSAAQMALNIGPQDTLFNSANDPDRDFKIGTGTTDDFFVIDSGDDTLTISGNITASGNISASTDILSRRFIVPTDLGTDTTHGYQFNHNGNLSTNRIHVTTAENMQFRCGNAFQFFNHIQVNTGKQLHIADTDNTSRFRIQNISTNTGSGDQNNTTLAIKNMGETPLIAISGSGNVGIGTTTPEDKLTIKDGNALITGSSTHELEISTANFNGKARLRLNTLREGVNAETGVPRGMGSSNLYKTGALTFFDTDEDLKIRPNSRLALNIGGTGDIRFVSSTIAGDDPQVETTYFIGDASTRRIGIGIGNTTPGEVLEVVGNISASGDILATNVSASILRISNPSHTGNLRFFQDSDNSYQLKSSIGTLFDFGNLNVITTSQRIDGTRGMTMQTFKASDLIKFRDFDSNDIIVVDNSGSLTLGNTSAHEPYVTINTDLTASGNISASGDIFADTASFFNIILDHRGTAEPTLTFESDGGPDFTFGFNGDNNLQLSGQTGASGQTFSLASEVENFRMNSGGTILATAGNNAGTGSKHDGGLFVENQNSETSNGKAAQFTALSTGGVLKNTAYGGTGKHGTFKFINGGNLNNGVDATEHVVAEFGPTSSAHFTFHVPIIASGDISASGNIILDGTADIKTGGATDDIRIIPDNFLELGTVSTDQIFIGRDDDWVGNIKLQSGNGVTMTITGSKVGIGTTTPSFALDITGSLANNNDGGVVRFESAGGGDLIFNDGCQGSNETAIQFNQNGRISGEGGKLNFSSNTLDITFNTGSGIRDISTPALTISGSGQIKLDYDNMPTSNPNEKGVIYRSSSNGMDNLLFISPG